MSPHRRTTVSGLMIAALLLAACGSSDGDDDGDVTPADSSQGTAAQNGGADEGGQPTTAEADPPAGGGDAGSATLTVGDTVYMFPEFLCAFGYDSTQSETYSFSSNSFAEIDGARVQMQLDVADETGGDRLTGEGTKAAIHVDDIEDFENPAVSLRSTGDLVATFDGDSITAEGVFADEVTGLMDIPGTFTATCGAGSRR